MFGKFAWREEAKHSENKMINGKTDRKEKYKIVLSKGLDEKKRTAKMKFWKGRERQKKKKKNKKKWRIFEERVFGGREEEKTLKLQEGGLFAFIKKEKPNKQKPKANKKQKRKVLNTTWHAER